MLDMNAKDVEMKNSPGAKNLTIEGARNVIMTKVPR
jgi:hypothetical protein